MHRTRGIVVTAGLLAVLALTAGGLADKPTSPGNGGGGGSGGGGSDDPVSTQAYSVVDLLGLPGDAQGDYQSAALFLSEPVDGVVTVVGDSHVDTILYPAAWYVDSESGAFTVEELDVPLYTDNGMNVNDLGEILVKSQVESDESPEGIQYVLIPTESDYLKWELPTAGGVTAYARAINNQGTIVGYVVFDDGTDRSTQGAVWQLQDSGPSQPTLLPDFEPEGISDTNVLAGTSFSHGAAIAWFDENGLLQVDPIGNLAGYDYTHVTAISSDGNWVVGYARTYPGEYFAEGFVWSLDEGMRGTGRLGGNSSRALAVNIQGQVVGVSDAAGGKYSRTAFLWQGGQLRDLNDLVDSKVHLDSARDINNNGNIVGMTKLSRPLSELHGFLLIPESN